MSWITNILSGGAGALVGEIGGIVDQFHLSGEEKQEFKLKLESLLQNRDSEVEQTIRAELQAKERVLVAELQQDDKFTKRARPAIVWAGLLFIAWNYCVIPSLMTLFDKAIQPFALPVEFWAAWGGICTTWVIGRSAEKRGSRSKVTNVITGSKAVSVFD